MVRGEPVPSRVPVSPQPRAPAVSRVRAGRVSADRRPDGASSRGTSRRDSCRVGPMEQQRSGIPSFQARGELALELVHATEAAALASARFLGKGDPDRVAEAASDAMYRSLEASSLTGTVVLSPRHQTQFPPGTVIMGGDRQVDIGPFPIEGASQVARGHINAVSVLVAVEPGGFAKLPAVSHAEKIAAGHAARGAIDLDDPIADNLRRIAFAKN